MSKREDSEVRPLSQKLRKRAVQAEGCKPYSMMLFQE
jgi:hypothetical protein